MTTNPHSLSDEFSHTIEGVREKSAESISRAREEASGMIKCANARIREKPLCCVLSAAAAGIAIGWWIGYASRPWPWHQQAIHSLRDNAGDAFGKLRHNLKFR